MDNLEVPKTSMNRPVFVISALLIVCFSIYGSAFNEHASASFLSVQKFLVGNFGWFYGRCCPVFFVHSLHGVQSLWLYSTRPRRFRTRLFLLYLDRNALQCRHRGWPHVFWRRRADHHFAKPPARGGGTVEAAEKAMLITYFHWGMQAWGTYILVGLALAYFAFRRGLPLTVSSALYPLIGEKIYGGIGNTVNVLAVLGTMFGIATSLGLGVMQVNAGLNYLFGIEVSGLNQVLLIGMITLIATMSVVAGLNSGIKRLSQANAVLAVFLLLFITSPDQRLYF